MNEWFLKRDGEYGLWIKWGGKKKQVQTRPNPQHLDSQQQSLRPKCSRLLSPAGLCFPSFPLAQMQSGSSSFLILLGQFSPPSTNLFLAPLLWFAALFLPLSIVGLFFSTYPRPNSLPHNSFLRASPFISSRTPNRRLIPNPHLLAYPAGM